MLKLNAKVAKIYNIAEKQIKTLVVNYTKKLAIVNRVL